MRYGYRDLRNEQEPFETILVERLKEFLRDESWLYALRNEGEGGENEIEELKREKEEKRKDALERELDTVEKAWHAGVVYLMGESEIVAGRGSSLGKRILLNYAYNFLRRNLRQSDKVFDIPHKRLLKVGMTYEL